MSNRSSREREVREIAIAANSDEATNEQLARLDELIRNDPYLANYAARLFEQQAALAWQGSTGERPIEPVTSAATTAAASSDRARILSSFRMSSIRRTLGSWPTIAAGIAFLLGMAVNSLSHRRDASDSLPIVAAGSTSTLGHPSYEARLIRSTACLWDGDSVGSREIGSGLTSGESLHLLEGLAEFNLKWIAGGSATISLEGPAGMMLTSEGMPMLRFGRLTATINTLYRPFVLETPVGRLVLNEYGSIGVSAFGNDGEIHVFDGSATLEPAWRTTGGRQSERVSIKAGQAIRIQEDAGGELSLTRHSADEAYFVAQLSMSSDALLIPPAYVAAVKGAQPIGYWRFERKTWPEIPNEMGPRFACHVNGALGTTMHQSNQAVEFGVTDEDGDILSNETFEGQLTDSYSIELWIKPSHYHVGAVVSLVGDPITPTSGVVPHGMLLEMGGTGLIPNALTLHHPGRIRFLHRSPASNDPDLGSSCYSKAAYTLRKWQHVVLVKDPTMMRLYVDGVLAGEAEDASHVPADLRLLVGKLYPGRRVRPFIGQLDELAIYDRALGPEEIAAHYRAVRPVPAAKPGA